MIEMTDLSWLQKFSGGLDLIPVGIAIVGIFLSFRLPKPESLDERFANILAMICFVALPVAQIGWISSVVRGVPMMGSIMDNVWTIYNFASLGAIMILQRVRRS